MSRIALALLLLLAAPAAAQAGGWATVELDRPPSGLTAGEPWNVELIVKQHGITPLDDARPTLVIDNGAGVTRSFGAHRTGHGTYAAAVTFPEAGTWRTRIYDGWTDATVHRLAPLTVSGSSGGGLPAAQAVAIAAMALVWAGLWLAVTGVPRPRRRAAPLRARGAA